MSQNYTYIIYNSDYGGYSMNRDFLVELFKRYVMDKNIRDKLFNFENKNNNNDNLNEDDLETEYFLNYRITNERIFDISNGTNYYLSEHCTEFRSNEYVINYIFERTLLKILNSNEFTPYFYRVLFQLDRDKFSTQIQNENDLVNLVELENVSQESIHNCNLQIIYNRARRKIGRAHV